MRSRITDKQKLKKEQREKVRERLWTRCPVAIVDIGSNSIRQVIYEGMTRAPCILFNEKVLCGLGKGLATGSYLNEQAVKCSLSAIQRFRALAQQIGVSQTFVLATAATRNAKNGPEFVRKIKKICNCEVNVLTGEMEAFYCADGIKSGFYDPEGIVGDMGGGSLELAQVSRKSNNGKTFPLGGLALKDLSGGSLKKARVIVTRYLNEYSINWPGDQKIFFAVGGIWRALSRLHIAWNGYPLNVIHNYDVNAREFIKFCNKIIHLNVDSISNIDRISKNRRDMLQYGAIVLAEILVHLEAERVIISSSGIREGYLYSRLDTQERKKDALLETSWDMAVLHARDPLYSKELAAWSTAAFEVLDIDETENEHRYRIAACHLADIGWRAHPDYRAAESLAIVSNAAFSCLDHEGRAYLSLATFYRHQGLGARVEPPVITQLAGKRVIQRARLLAGLFRVGYLYSGSMPNALPKISFKKTRSGVIMTLPENMEDLRGERPDLRLKQLGREAEIEIRIKTH